MEYKIEVTTGSGENDGNNAVVQYKLEGTLSNTADQVGAGYFDKAT